MTIKPCRVADSYSLFTNPDPAFQKSSDPDLDFDAHKNVFCRKICGILFDFELLKMLCSSQEKNIKQLKTWKRVSLEDVL
jgi:hypothetical protein